MSKTNVLEVEVDAPCNESHYFRPLQRRCRGRFDVLRCAEPMARLKTVEWPQPIPGVRIGVDLSTGAGYIAEPLHEPANAETMARIAQRGFSVPPAREDFAAVHVPTWLFWLRRAVESGQARVVKGELPGDEATEGAETSFITGRRPSTNDRLAEAIERNTEILAALLDRLAR